MIVFRLIKQKYSSDWTGRGAAKIGRRWNSKGIPMIYTSESRALCTAEVALHLSLGIIARGYEMLTINIPEDITIYEITVKALPDDWKSVPFLFNTQKLGDQFILENKYSVLKVPSAIIPGDSNYLINPRHPDFGKIEIIKKEPYEFDERFFKR